MLPSRILRAAALVAISAAVPLVLPLFAAGKVARTVVDGNDWTYHSFVPLGFEPLQLAGSKTELILMATAENPQFEGWHRLTRDHHRVLLTPDGAAVANFPEHINFRITASTRVDKAITADAPNLIPGGRDVQAWMKSLHFRMKVFRGLESFEIEPASVKILGVPFDVPYDERIYQVSFDLKDVPTTDRLVVEVFSPDGGRVARFHFELL